MQSDPNKMMKAVKWNISMVGTSVHCMDTDLKGQYDNICYGFNFAGCEIILLPTVTSCDAVIK